MTIPCWAMYPFPSQWTSIAESNTIFPITSFANAVHFCWMYDRRKVNDGMILFKKSSSSLAKHATWLVLHLQQHADIAVARRSDPGVRSEHAPQYGIQVRLRCKDRLSYRMPSQNRMHETLHLPSSPTVLSARTAPWFLRRGRGGANQRASCGVRVVPACLRACVCVCEQDEEPDKKKKKCQKKVKEWGIAGLEQLWEWRESVRSGRWGGNPPKQCSQRGRSSKNTRTHTHVPNVIFQTFHSHCAGFFVLLQTASSSLCCDDGKSCCHTIKSSFFLMETKRFFLFPPFLVAIIGV